MPTAEAEERVRKAGSMRTWLPKLIGSGVPIPDTEVIPFRDWEEATEFSEGWPAVTEELLNDVEYAIDSVGGSPAFIRTDQASAKHSMGEASLIPDSAGREIVREHVSELFRFNGHAGFAGLPFRDVVVREWLELEHKFEAFNQTPIAAELRVFVHDRQVHSYGWYWPSDAIRSHIKHETPPPGDWEEQLATLRDQTLTRFEPEVRPLAEKVANEFEGYWSVDFAATESGRWVALDAAPGVASWHPEGCERPEYDGLGIEV